MPAPRRGDAVETAYAECAETIRRVAYRFARRYRLPGEDVHQEACLVFLEAFRKHDPARGPLKRLLPTAIWNRLLDPVRAKIRHASYVEVRLTAGDAPSYTPPTPYEPPAAADDARTVIHLLLATPADLAEAFRAAPHPGPSSVRRELRGYLLRSLRWTEERAARAFAGARAAVA